MTELEFKGTPEELQTVQYEHTYQKKIPYKINKKLVLKMSDYLEEIVA